jgi:osmotically-inducible protein OsmY
MTPMSDSPDQSDQAPAPPGPAPLALADAVREALALTRHGWLQRVTVVVESGAVVLRGRVPSFYLKQLAQVTVMAVAGVGQLRNELRVEGGDQ